VRVLVVFLSILLLSAAILLAATVGPERVLTQLHALVRAYLEGPAPAAVPTSSASAAASGKQAASAKPGDSDSDAREGPIAESQRRVPNCTELLRDQPASKSPKRAGLTPHQQAALAEHLELRNDLTGALRAYCAGVAAFPESASLRAGEVNMLLSMGDADAALKEAREALKVFPNSARIEDLLGDALAHRGQWDEARQTWLDAAGVRSDDQEAVMHLAHQHLNPAREALNQRKFGLARQYFRRAALLDPTDAEAATGVVQMLLRLDDAKPAVVWARRLLKLQPRMSAAHVILGQALAKSGDMSGAEAAWRTALEYNPGDEEAKRRLQALRQARD
jgi:Flp pilus assembly protein TadD